MDEPTNDLDLETLDLLEDRLLEYSGTLLVVSHDRAFLDAVVTSTIVLEGRGRVAEYAGGYSDWVRQRPAQATVTEGKPAAPKAAPAAALSAPTPAPTKKRKLSFAESKELAALPDRIEAAEQQREGILARLQDPTVLRDGQAALAAHQQLTAIEAEVATLLERWEALETIASEGR